MSDLQQQVEEVRSSFGLAVTSVATTDALQELRVKYLGKKGALTALLKSLGGLEPEERPRAGEALNALRDELEQKIEQLKSSQTQRKTPQSQRKDDAE